jgi:hypothetical protein
MPFRQRAVLILALLRSGVCWDDLAPEPRQVRRCGFCELHRRAMSEADRYKVIVTQIGGQFGAWQYEIHRDGRPLPARVQDTGFRTRYIATLAGNAAREDFLLGLAHEQRKA